MAPLIEHGGNYYTYSEFQDALSTDTYLFHSAFRRMGQALDLVTSDNDQEMASKFQSAMDAAVLRYNDPEEFPHLTRMGSNARMRGCMFVSYPYNGSFNRPGPVPKWAWEVIFQKQVKKDIEERHRKTPASKEEQREDQDSRRKINIDERQRQSPELMNRQRGGQGSDIKKNIDERHTQSPDLMDGQREDQGENMKTNNDERHTQSTGLKEEQGDDQDS